MEDPTVCKEGATDSGCLPSWATSDSPPTLASRIGFLFSMITFLGCFLLVAGIVKIRRIYASLCTGRGLWGYKLSSTDVITSGARISWRLGEVTFASTMGATGVLGLLILCEVSDWLNSSARGYWFSIVIGILLVELVVVAPLLQVHGLLDTVGLARLGKGKRWLWALEGVMYAFWLWGFWSVGSWVPDVEGDRGYWWGLGSRSLTEECLSRIGLVGVTLMAILSGFGAVSSAWTAFFTKTPREVTETDIARAQAGLDSANEMLEMKRKSARALEKKIEEKKKTQQGGFMSKVFQSINRDSDTRELAVLQTELSGLTTMAESLSLNLARLQSLYATSPHNPSKSLSSRLIPHRSIFILFSVYCIYRILATAFAHLPYPFSTARHSPDAVVAEGSASSDPINRLLALLTHYWDPSLDQDAWARQIGFCLSGVIIAGSVNRILSVVTFATRKLLSPFTISSSSLPSSSPTSSGPATGVGQILALATAQITAAYVLAAALLLRASLGPGVGGVITKALGAAGLGRGFVEGWFDGVFLGSVAVVGIVYWIGRMLKIVGKRGVGWGDEWDEEQDALGYELEDGKIV